MIIMREYISTNLKVIKIHLKKRTKKLSKLNINSIKEEFREWDDPSFDLSLPVSPEVISKKDTSWKNFNEEE